MNNLIMNKRIMSRLDPDRLPDMPMRVFKALSGFLRRTVRQEHGDGSFAVSASHMQS
jgi:hypothetical protein